MSAVGKLVGKVTGTDKAARRAAGAQRQATAAEERMFEKSMGFQREMWDWQKEQAAPWTEAGLGALGQYKDTMTGGFQFDPSSDPVYQARLKEQSKAIARAGAAGGTRLSGATLKDLSQMTASELGASYGRQFDQHQAQLNNLANIVNIGRGSAMNLQQLGQGFTSGLSGTMGQLGQSQSQMYQNLGTIGAQAATAPFQNLMSLGQTAGGMMLGAGMLSDVRLKTDIVKVGKYNDMNVYDFKYIWDDKTTYRGLMAQEVEKIIPEAVFEVEGYKAIDYSKVI